MNQILTNLQWMELKIDWFSFNFQANEKKELNQFIVLFKKYNIYVWFLDENKPNMNSFLPPEDSLLTVFIVTFKKKYNWDGLQLRITGLNASQFYDFLQMESKNPDWKEVMSLLTSDSLSRIDIKYIRKDKVLDPNFLDFASLCQQLIKEKNSDVLPPKYAITTSSTKIVIANGQSGRRNNKYLRIYKQEETLCFELELKNFSEQISNAFFNFQFHNFEELCVQTFTNRVQEVLPLHSIYLDWFVEKIRIHHSISPTGNSESTLLFTYLEGNMISKNHSEKLRWFRFFQFINFLQRKKNDPAFQIYQETLMGQKYSIFKFRLHEFLDFLQIQNHNHYQKQKLVKFFEHFTIPNLVVGSSSFQFSEGNTLDQESYIAHAVFPVFKLSKRKDTLGIGSAWTIEMAVSENFINFNYPHIFYDTPGFAKSKYEIDLTVVMLHAYCTRAVEKKLNIDEFIQSYNGSYQTQIHIRKLIFKFFIRLVNQNQIQSLFDLEYSDGTISKTTQLNQNDMLKISFLTFYEKIKLENNIH